MYKVHISFYVHHVTSLIEKLFMFSYFRGDRERLERNRKSTLTGQEVDFGYKTRYHYFKHTISSAILFLTLPNQFGLYEILQPFCYFYYLNISFDIQISLIKFLCESWSKDIKSPYNELNMHIK